MKILKPIKKLPSSVKARQRYLEIWARVKKLKNGVWLPVQCSDELLADRLARGARMRRPPLQARGSGSIVYLRRKQ
jgi:hypothetical protein